jgi:hypothetical protein
MRNKFKKWLKLFSLAAALLLTSCSDQGESVTLRYCYKFWYNGMIDATSGATISNPGVYDADYNKTYLQFHLDGSFIDQRTYSDGTTETLVGTYWIEIEGTVQPSDDVVDFTYPDGTTMKASHSLPNTLNVPRNVSLSGKETSVYILFKCPVFTDCICSDPNGSVCSS